jgi:hypothetical protein
MDGAKSRNDIPDNGHRLHKKKRKGIKKKGKGTKKRENR